MARAQRWLAGSGLDTIMVLVIVVASAAVLGTAAQRVPFNGDEGNYLCTSSYFDYLFLQHDVSREEWRDNYWTHTQPMLIRYVAGAWLWASGYELAAMRPYCDFDWTLTRTANAARGFVPGETLVVDSRAPMVFVGT